MLLAVYSLQFLNAPHSILTAVWPPSNSGLSQDFACWSNFCFDPAQKLHSCYSEKHSSHTSGVSLHTLTLVNLASWQKFTKRRKGNSLVAFLAGGRERTGKWRQSFHVLSRLNVCMSWVSEVAVYGCIEWNVKEHPTEMKTASINCSGWAAPFILVFS